MLWYFWVILGWKRFLRPMLHDDAKCEGRITEEYSAGVGEWCWSSNEELVYAQELDQVFLPPKESRHAWDKQFAYIILSIYVWSENELWFCNGIKFIWLLAVTRFRPYLVLVDLLLPRCVATINVPCLMSWLQCAQCVIVCESIHLTRPSF